jgi:Transposase
MYGSHVLILPAWPCWRSCRASVDSFTTVSTLSLIVASSRGLIPAFPIWPWHPGHQNRWGVLNVLMGCFRALQWQRLPEVEQLGDFLLTHIEGIAAYCDHPVRCGVVESINTTIKAVLRRARGRDDAMLLSEIQAGYRQSNSVRSRLGALSDCSTAVLKSVKTGKNPAASVGPKPGRNAYTRASPRWSVVVVRRW